MNPTPPAAMAIVEAALDGYRRDTPPDRQTPAEATQRIAAELRASGYAITQQPTQRRRRRQSA